MSRLPAAGPPVAYGGARASWHGGDRVVEPPASDAHAGAQHETGHRKLPEHVLERAKQADYPGCRPGERNLLRDVQEMLLRRELGGFVNRLRALSPVEPYQRRIFLLGRALAPVEPYTPQLLPTGR